ncbi:MULTISPECIES: DegT/DnrJ/EryC1/StrS family aminotransferase [unclassified Kitasatospora]|uniref:DegT/DnrJ/EryC1/StrS family aminotransferase n=1 Tax=unclassified Kitasatospora TaxID=2633591 RepID=UPI00382A1C6A
MCRTPSRSPPAPPAGTGARLVADPPHGTTNYQSCWVLPPDGAPDRAELLARLAGAGVLARRGIVAAHLEAPYKGAARVPLPAAELLTRRSPVLPLYHSLTERQQDRVTDALRAALPPR